MGIHFLLIVFFLLCSETKADVKGSDIAVSVENYFTFPESPGIANEIAAFAWMKNGFKLQSSNTECKFGSVFPVSGNVDLNNGTFVLEADLRLLRDVTLTNLGTITGNNHTFTLDIPSLPSTGATFSDTHVVLNSDVIITCTFTFSGVCSLEGHGALIDVSDGSFVIDSGATLKISHASVIGLKNSNIQCVDDSGRLILEGVKLIQKDHFDWQKGAILFENSVDVTGTYTFSFESSMTSTIDVNTRLNFTQTLVRMGRNTANQANAIYFEDKSSEVRLDNTDFITTASGIMLQRGSLLLSRIVNLDILGTYTYTGVLLGDGKDADNDITIWVEPGASVFHNSGYWVYNNIAKNQLKSTSQHSRLIRSELSRIYVPKSFEIENLTIEVVSNLVYPVEVDSGQKLSYLHATVRLPDIECDLKTDQLNYYTYQLDNDDYVFLTKGTLPMYQLVTGAGNTIRGNGGLSGGIVLAHQYAHLTMGLNGFVDNTITLNNGTLALDYNLLLFKDGKINGPGHVNLGSSRLDITSAFGDTPIYWEGNKGEIILNGKVSLSSTWTFKGNCRIIGTTAKIELKEGGNIVVEDDSSLSFRNLRVLGLSGNNIRCKNDNGNITILRTDMELTDDFKFEKGRFKSILENTVSGAYTFSYDSVRTSTIRSDSTLCFAKECEFYLGRNGGNEPIYFQDKTSRLKFNDAKITVKDTGVKFTRGIVEIDKNIVVTSSTESSEKGLTFGDGTEDGDIEIVINPATSARFPAGYMTYDITHAKGIVSKSNAARLIRLAGSIFYCKHDVTLEDLTVDVSYYSQLIVDPGKIISYKNIRIISGKNEFDIDGIWYNPFTFILNGGFAAAAQGEIPLYLLVQGTGNSVEGVGNVSGGIILSDSTANITFNINGLISNSPTLNGGSVTVGRDINLANEVIFTGNGIINLNDNSFVIGKFPTTWPGNLYWNSSGGNISLNAQIDLTGTWTVKGDLEIKGNNQIMNIKNGGFTVDSNSNLTLSNLQLNGLHSTNFKCADNTSNVKLKNCSLVMDSNFTFSKGSIEFNQKNNLSGMYTFSYDSIGTSTILTESTFGIKDSATLAIGRNEGREPLYFVDSSSTLKFDNSNFYIKETGVQLTRGRAVIDHDIVVDANSTHTGNGLVFGNGNADDDFEIFINPATSARFPRGHMTYHNVSPDKIKSKSKTAKLLRLADSVFFLYSNLALSDITVDASAVSDTTINPSAGLSYTNSVIVNDQNEFEINGSWYTYYMYLLANGGVVNLLNGTCQVYLLVVGPGNLIGGVGNLSGAIILNDTNAEVTCDFNGSLHNNITSSGGTLNLTKNLNMGGGYSILGAANVNLNSVGLNLGTTDLNWTSGIYWTGDHGAINLNGNVDLLNTWTIKGKVELNGNGHVLRLKSGGKIVIDSDSSLCMRNLTVEDIGQSDLLCVDNTGVLILDNVSWIQLCLHDYLFSKGAIRFINTVSIGGNINFVYDSQMTSTICSDSRLKLDNGYTFSFAPVYPGTIELEDQTSQFMLNGSTLHITTTDLALTKGTLRAKGASRLCVYQKEHEDDATGETVVTRYQLILGDGNAENDCGLALDGGAVLQVDGTVVYNNVQESSFNTENKNSVLRLLADSDFVLNNSITLGEGYIRMDPAASITRNNDSTIIGSIIVGGD